MLSYVQLNVFLLILSLYPFFFSPVATADLSLAAQCLRKFTANVLAIRNVIILKGFRTVKGMHIKRKARMVYPFAAQTTVKCTKKKCSRLCARCQHCACK